jgi:hypothetical protein
LKQKNINWRDFSNLYTRDESFNMRMSAVEKGIKERINLLPLIKKFKKMSFSDFLYKKTPDGRHVFYKKIHDFINLGIGFDTIHHWGFGKAFTLCLNIEHTDDLYSGIFGQIISFGCMEKKGVGLHAIPIQLKMI